MAEKTILVFTGGGLCPALNSILSGVISRGQSSGFKILGGLHGWASLLENGKVIDLTNFNVEKIKNIGGTFLRSSRTNPLKVPNGQEQIKDAIKKYGIDAIIAIGGDDTLGTAHILSSQLEIPIIGIPKTIDNDLSETYWTPGYPSAAHYFADFVRSIKEHAAYTLSRVFVIEAPGFKSGWLAASGAYGMADIILPPEEIINCRHVIEKLEEAYLKNGNYAVVVISQYARFDIPIVGRSDEQSDQYDTARNIFIGLSFTDFLKSELKMDIRSLHPGNYLESVRPIEIDKKLSILLGEKAVDEITKGTTGMAICLKRADWNNSNIEVTTCSLEAMAGKGNYNFLQPDMFDFENFKVTQKFFDYLEPALGKNPALENNEYLELQKEIIQK